MTAEEQFQLWWKRVHPESTCRASHHHCAKYAWLAAWSARGERDASITKKVAEDHHFDTPCEMEHEGMSCESMIAAAIRQETP